MSVTRWLAVALAVSFVALPAHAKRKADKDKDADTDSDEESSDDEDKKPASDAEEESSDDSGGDDEEAVDDDEGGGKKVKDKTKAKSEDDGAIKQDLSGHDLGTNKKENLFEKDRFFVDKVDTKKTEKTTLVQGSLASSSLLYTERGGSYGTMLGNNSATFSRYYTELRLQTDFRHISGGKWDARIDARARMVPTPTTDPLSADPVHIQSGFNGRNEYDLRELWLFHSGKRADVFFGRQYIPDLGAIKIDGLRVDYASSRKVTLIGFGGLYPLKGSRSITTDYIPLKDNELNSAGKFVGAGGFGGAYRTINAYGSVGGVALVPFAGESPRIFATSSGYYRSGSTLDFYHFALLDAVSAVGPGVTNLSAGLNYKPNPRLRVTASFNRVDVDTLKVQSNSFLNPIEGGAPTVVQNETYLRRLATNSARGGVSAALGQLQRFEVSLQAAYRFRPAVALDDAAGTNTYTLDAAKGVDLYAAFTDRRSFKDMRIGFDVSRSFGVGDQAFQRSEILGLRASAARELANGHGEWEAEVSYTTTKDSAAGIVCLPGAGGAFGDPDNGDPNAATNRKPSSCFGSSNGAILSIGGTLFYRINRDWLAIGSAYITRQTLTHNDVDPAMLTNTIAATDPTVTGLMGFFRIAYRF